MCVFHKFYPIIAAINGTGRRLLLVFSIIFVYSTHVTEYLSETPFWVSV